MEPQAADWYPDPKGEYDHRYWNGQKWTEHVSRAGKALIDPGHQHDAAVERTESSVHQPGNPDDLMRRKLVDSLHSALKEMMAKYNRCCRQADEVEKSFAMANADFIGGVRQSPISKENIRELAVDEERELEALLGDLRAATVAAKKQWDDLLFMLPGAGSESDVMKIANWCMSNGVSSDIFSAVIANGIMLQADFGGTRQSFWAEKQRIDSVVANAGSANKPTAQSEPANVATPQREHRQTDVELMAARALLSDLIHTTHRQGSIGNDELFSLFSRFQEAGGLSSNPHKMAAAVTPDQISSLSAQPWHWLARTARKAGESEDHELVAYAAFWAGTWQMRFHNQFREFLTRAMLLIGPVPEAVRSELRDIARTSLAKLPRDHVLFGDNTGQVTAGWVADSLDQLLG